MSIKAIRLELARSKTHPQGDPAHGYELRAPLDSLGHLDAAAWPKAKDLCVVRRLEKGAAVETGLLQRTGKGRWVFSYAPGQDDDESIFRLGQHAFLPGEYISITEHDGLERTFRVASVTAWHPAP